MKQTIKLIIRRILPLSTRKALVVWMSRQDWISTNRRYWYAQELIRDLESKDANAYHKFLWRHHLAYAQTYEIERRFGEENIDASRIMLFQHAIDILKKLDISPEEDIHSVFEVGCSLGYLLRHLETTVFPAAKTLEGIDIDQYAISAGIQYLSHHRSNVKLGCSDMESLNQYFNGRSFDIVICAGVLMYLKETEAQRVVDTVLAHTNTLLIMSGLAHPQMDNDQLQCSDVRDRDGTFIHNFDAMVGKAGGEVVYRRYEGERLVDGHTVYFILARPNR